MRRILTGGYEDSQGEKVLGAVLHAKPIGIMPDSGGLLLLPVPTEYYQDSDGNFTGPITAGVNYNFKVVLNGRTLAGMNFNASVALTSEDDPISFEDLYRTKNALTVVGKTVQEMIDDAIDDLVLEAGGVTAHNQLTGLTTGDDHPQYHNNARGDARYTPTTTLTTLLGGKADLVGGLVPTSQIPALAINDVFPVASQAAMLALTAQRGDMALRSDVGPGGTAYVLAAEPASTLANWLPLPAGASVTSVNGQTGIVVLNAGNVGAAAAGHIHPQSEVTGLLADLAAKLNISSKATQAQAEAGTDDVVYMTALKVAQAIAALTPGGGTGTIPFSMSAYGAIPYNPATPETWDADEAHNETVFDTLRDDAIAANLTAWWDGDYLIPLNVVDNLVEGVGKPFDLRGTNMLTCRIRSKRRSTAPVGSAPRDYLVGHITTTSGPAVPFSLRDISVELPYYEVGNLSHAECIVVRHTASGASGDARINGVFTIGGYRPLDCDTQKRPLIDGNFFFAPAAEARICNHDTNDSGDLWFCHNYILPAGAPSNVYALKCESGTAPMIKDNFFFVGSTYGVAVVSDNPVSYWATNDNLAQALGQICGNKFDSYGGTAGSAAILFDSAYNKGGANTAVLQNKIAAYIVAGNLFTNCGVQVEVKGGTDAVYWLFINNNLSIGGGGFKFENLSRSYVFGNCSFAKHPSGATYAAAKPIERIGTADGVVAFGNFWVDFDEEADIRDTAPDAAMPNESLDNISGKVTIPTPVASWINTSSIVTAAAHELVLPVSDGRSGTHEFRYGSDAATPTIALSAADVTAGKVLVKRKVWDGSAWEDGPGFPTSEHNLSVHINWQSVGSTTYYSIQNNGTIADLVDEGGGGGTYYLDADFSGSVADLEDYVPTAGPSAIVEFNNGDPLPVTGGNLEVAAFNGHGGQFRFPTTGGPVDTSVEMQWNPESDGAKFELQVRRTDNDHCLYVSASAGTVSIYERDGAGTDVQLATRSWSGWTPAATHTITISAVGTAVSVLPSDGGSALTGTIVNNLTAKQIGLYFVQISAGQPAMKIHSIRASDATP